MAFFLCSAKRQLFRVCSQAGAVVLCKPDVRQVTLPSTGARVVIASDGLWDAVTPKTALHHVRGMHANKAARELVGVRAFTNLVVP